MSESEADRMREALAQITQRTPGEIAILMRVAHGNEIAKACTMLCRRFGWQPAKLDWRTLFACNLIKREGDRGFIVLTSQGLHWQRRIAHEMARVAGLHLLMPHGEDRFNVTCRCTCGWSATLSKNQGHVISGQFRHFGQHLDAVAKGVWKQPRSVEQVVEDVMARHAAPLVPAQASEVVNA